MVKLSIRGGKQEEYTKERKKNIHKELQQLNNNSSVRNRQGTKQKKRVHSTAVFAFMKNVIDYVLKTMTLTAT